MAFHSPSRIGVPCSSVHRMADPGRPDPGHPPVRFGSPSALPVRRIHFPEPDPLSSRLRERGTFPVFHPKTLSPCLHLPQHLSSTLPAQQPTNRSLKERLDGSRVRRCRGDTPVLSPMTWDGLAHTRPLARSTPRPRRRCRSSVVSAVVEVAVPPARHRVDQLQVTTFRLTSPRSRSTSGLDHPPASLVGGQPLPAIVFFTRPGTDESDPDRPPNGCPSFSPGLGRNPDL